MTEEIKPIEIKPIKHKYKSKGEKHHQARLSDEEVILIKELRAKHWTQMDIADKFGVSQCAISRILNNKIRKE